MSKADRRRHQRKKPSGQLSFGLQADSFNMVAQIQDLSRCGAYCRVDKPISEMTRLMVVLDLENDRIKCDATVVRTESVPDKSGYNIAIFFNDISESDQEKIANLTEN